MSESLSLL